MAADGDAAKTDANINLSTPVTNPQKRLRPDGSPIVEDTVDLPSPAIMKAFQVMLDEALKQQSKSICDSINSKIDEQALKIEEQAARISDLQKATETNTKVVNNLRTEFDILRHEHHEKIELLNKNVNSQTEELGEIKKTIPRP